MGMQAVYIAVEDKVLNKLQKLSEEDLIEELEEIQNNEEADTVDIMKMWDALHFVLTGVSASEPIEDNELSEFVVGVEVILADDEFVAFSSKTDVRRIWDAIQSIDFETYREKFNPEVLGREEIYPNIWGEDKNSLFEEIKEAFEDLRDFYNRNQNLNIIATIY